MEQKTVNEMIEEVAKNNLKKEKAVSVIEEVRVMLRKVGYMEAISDVMTLLVDNIRKENDPETKIHTIRVADLIRDEYKNIFE